MRALQDRETPRAIASAVPEDDEIMREIIRMLDARTAGAVPISPDTNVVRDLGFDSLAVMNFVMDLEDRFDLSIALDRMAEIETVADLVSAIRLLRAGAGGS